MEGHPDGAGEVHLPRVREDHAAASTLPCDTPRLCWPNLLAMILFEKFAQHQPLNRQSERYAREGIDLSLSTLADPQAGAIAAVELETDANSSRCCIGSTMDHKANRAIIRKILLTEWDPSGCRTFLKRKTNMMPRPIPSLAC